MQDSVIQGVPKIHDKIVRKSEEIGFTMPSDLYVGSLLKTLISSKPGGNFLELGTGIGLSLSWMVEGMDENSKLISVDNDAELIAIANTYFGTDSRLELVCADGAEWIKENPSKRFDLIFADAWPGKYGQLEEVLQMVKIGGYYVIDDMSRQPNWPAGHDENVKQLITDLEGRNNFQITKMNWSTGLVLAVKKY